MKWYPLKFKPVYKDYPWGNTGLPDRFNRGEPTGIYAESWEVSTHPDGESIISNGAYAGQPLAQLIDQTGADLLGSAVEGTEFPLLIKLIDAATPLSVQVHPNEITAESVQGDPKTEAWYFLNEQPAQVYCGLLPGTSREALHTAIEQGDFAPILRTIPAIKGGAVYVPGGRVHAIDAGCFLLEVQETSNTTFRLYDWDRVGNDGKPRELHVDKAQRVIDFEDHLDPVCQPTPIADGVRNICTSPFFVLNELTLNGKMKVQTDGKTCHVLFSADGAFTIHYGHNQTEPVDAGTSVLIPAALNTSRLQSDTPIPVLQISM
jgi:mannose-6-phosphate isomerase